MALKHSTLTSLFTDIANAIRRKTKSTDRIIADSFPSAIRAIDTKNAGGNIVAFTSVTEMLNGTFSRTYPDGLGEDRAHHINYSTNYNNRISALRNSYAFYYTGASKIYMPGITEMLSTTFVSNFVTYIDAPDLLSLPDYAFNNYRQLQEANFAICSYIGGQAFLSCTALLQVSFPTCSYISNNAFNNCTSLSQISLPACSSMGTYTFYNCTSLETVNLPLCNYVNHYAFKYCTHLPQISLPACSYIGEQAFYGCTSLETVNLPACSYIGGQAFLYCPSLSQVSLPACSYIDNQAFNGCSSLSQVSLPVCSYIGQIAFQNCTSLHTLILLSNSIVSLFNTGCFNNTPMSVLSLLGIFGSIYVPASMVDAYKSAKNWSAYSNRITSYQGY